MICVQVRGCMYVAVCSVYVLANIAGFCLFLCSFSMSKLSVSVCMFACMCVPGNVMVVPILKTVGLSQGMLIWASVAMLTGWAVGRFT